MLHGQGDVDVQLHHYLFNGTMCGGSYIELGAMDGTSFSNSYYLNKAFDWKGVLIEATPTEAEKIPANRPNEIAIINAGVCHEPQTLHFVHKTGSVNGFWEFASPEFRRGFWKGVSLKRDTIPVECQTMSHLLQQHAPQIQHYDLFSLDVEGAELEALKSIDFTKIGFGVIVVEADARDKLKDQAVRDFLTAQGYVMVPKKVPMPPAPDEDHVIPDDEYQEYWPKAQEWNDFFLHKDFDTIYKQFSRQPRL
ncbi:expressed unknown protein [Seminavis robusta]|uniref:Methyltransferase FkbM domain-containing protein n=1 Tax=Seminavis robusta TaxID=568900 RepID=A0A9N8DM54_9STRA|nr:expressed unknown protein [Seminavis robusta]|eukprot:Sro132_g062500.1 n/a (251) ;mRNA; f:34208-34960